MKDEIVERINANYEFTQNLVAKISTLRATVEMLINCADPNRDMAEIRKAHQALKESEGI